MKMKNKLTGKTTWEIEDDLPKASTGKAVSSMGYRDDSPYRDSPSLDIHTPDGSIDMSQTGIPIMANGKYLAPYSGMHQFAPGVIKEVRMAQKGTRVTPKNPKAVQIFAEAPIRKSHKYNLSTDFKGFPPELLAMADKVKASEAAIHKLNNNTEYLGAITAWDDAQNKTMQALEQDIKKFRDEYPADRYDDTGNDDPFYNVVSYGSPYYSKKFHGSHDDKYNSATEDIYKRNKEVVDDYWKGKDLWVEARKRQKSIVDPMQDEQLRLESDFYNHPLNEEVSIPNPTFTTEANDLKNWYKKFHPEVPVDISSGYGPEFQKTVSGKLSTSTPETDIVIMGHSGDRYAGSPNSSQTMGIGPENVPWSWSDELGKAKYQNCYLGSCYGNKVHDVDGFKDVKNLYATVNHSWLGVNPKASNLLDAFFGTQSGEHGDFTGKAKEGEDYAKYSTEPMLRNSPMPDKAKMSYYKYGGTAYQGRDYSNRGYASVGPPIFYPRLQFGGNVVTEQAKYGLPKAQIGMQYDPEMTKEAAEQQDLENRRKEVQGIQSRMPATGRADFAPDPIFAALSLGAPGLIKTGATLGADALASTALGKVGITGAKKIADIATTDAIVGGTTLAGITPANIVGGAFFAKGVHDLPQTARTLRDPTKDGFDKAEAVVTNFMDLTGLPGAIGLGKGALSISKEVANDVNKLRLARKASAPVIEAEVAPISLENTKLGVEPEISLRRMPKEYQEMWKKYSKLPIYESPINNNTPVTQELIENKEYMNQAARHKDKYCPPGSACAKSSNNITQSIWNKLSPEEPYDYNGNAADAWYSKDQMIKNGGELVYDVKAHGPIHEADLSDLQVGDQIMMGPDAETEFAALDPKTKLRKEDNVRHRATVVGKNEQGVPIILESGLGNTVLPRPIDQNMFYHDQSNFGIRSIVRPRQFVGIEGKLTDRVLKNAQIDSGPTIQVNPAKELQPFVDVYDKYKTELAHTLNLNQDELLQVFRTIVGGIGPNETKLNNLLPGSKLAKAKIAIQDIFDKSGLTSPVKSGVNVVKRVANAVTYKPNPKLASFPGNAVVEMEAHKLVGDKKFSTLKEAVNHLYETKYNAPPKYPLNTTLPSKGMFKQKEISPTGEKLGLNQEKFTSNLSAQTSSAMANLTDILNNIRKAHPEYTFEKALDLATLSWNSPSKAANKELIDFYYHGIGNPDPKNINFDYLRKVKASMNKLIPITGVAPYTPEEKFVFTHELGGKISKSQKNSVTWSLEE
jgi:hypothetical protein